MLQKIKLIGKAALFYISVTSLASAAPEVYQITTQFGSDSNGTLIKQQTLAFAVETDGYLLSAYEPLVHPKTGEISRQLTLTTAPDQDVQVIGVEPTMGFAILALSESNEVEVFSQHLERDFEAGDFVKAHSIDVAGNLIQHEGQFTQMNALDCYQQSLTGTMFRAKIEIPKTGLGSPIFNQSGEVFAIHTGYDPIDESEEDDSELGIHLLPMSLAMTVYEGVKIRGNNESPWTGFAVRHLSAEEASTFPQYHGRIKGAIAIDYVWKGSQAEAMGIKRGDYLVKFGYYPIESVGDFQKWLYLYGVGQNIKIYLLRRGELVTLNYKIEARPSWAKPE